MTERGLTARLATPHTLSAPELACWERLCSTVPELASPFLTLHYARAAAAAGLDVRVCIISRDGQPCGFLPFQLPDRLSRLLGSAEPVGAEMTDYVGLVAEPGLQLDPAQLLRLAGLNHFAFSHLDDTQLGYGLAGEQPRVGLRIRLNRDSAQPLDTLLADNHKYRKDTERRSRQLAKEIGPIAFVLDVEHDRQAVLHKLVSHKRDQYRRTQAPDALADEWKTRLLSELSGYCFGGCRGLLSTMSSGGTWVAMHFGILGNGVLQYWLPVYNPAFSKYAPGRLLIHEIIGAGRAVGIHTIDRGEGDTPSKRELANEEHAYLRGAWHNQTLASGLSRAVRSLKWRLGT